MSHHLGARPEFHMDLGHRSPIDPHSGQIPGVFYIYVAHWQHVDWKRRQSGHLARLHKLLLFNDLEIVPCVCHHRRVVRQRLLPPTRITIDAFSTPIVDFQLTKRNPASTDGSGAGSERARTFFARATVGKAGFPVEWC